MLGGGRRGARPLAPSRSRGGGVSVRAQVARRAANRRQPLSQRAGIHLRMSFRTWWLENKLRRIDGKLKRLRFEQKRIRDREAELQKERRSGLSAEEAQGREAKLQSERERVGHLVSHLIGEEERLKRELRELGVSLAAH